MLCTERQGCQQAAGGHEGAERALGRSRAVRRRISDSAAEHTCISHCSATICHVVKTICAYLTPDLILRLHSYQHLKAPSEQRSLTTKANFELRLKRRSPCREIPHFKDTKRLLGRLKVVRISFQAHCICRKSKNASPP